MLSDSFPWIFANSDKPVDLYWLAKSAEGLIGGGLALPIQLLFWQDMAANPDNYRPTNFVEPFIRYHAGGLYLATKGRNLVTTKD